MTQIVIDVSNVNEIEVEDGISDSEVAAAVLSNEDVEVRHLNVYKVRAGFSGCVYQVEGQSPGEAEDALSTHIQSLIDEAEQCGPGSVEARHIFADMRTDAEVVEEIERDDPLVEIKRDGSRGPDY